MLNYITSVSLFAIIKLFSMLNAEREDVTSARREGSEFSSEKMLCLKCCKIVFL